MARSQRKSNQLLRSKLAGGDFFCFFWPKNLPELLAISTFQTPTGPNEMQSTEDCTSFGSTPFNELPKQEKDSHAQQGFIGFTFTLTILPQTSHKNKIPTFYFLATFGHSGPRHHFIAKYINIVWSPMISIHSFNLTLNCTQPCVWFLHFSFQSKGGHTL